MKSDTTRRANWWNFRLWALNAAIVLFSPLILLQKWRRYRKKRYFYEIDSWRWSARLPESWSQPATPRIVSPGAPRVVFVGSGIGELKTIECLSDLLEKERPDVHVVWALRGREVCELARKEHPERELATVPFEFIWPLWKWARALKPDVVVIVEKLWTPNLIWVSRCSGAAVVAANTNARAEPFSTRSRIWAPINAWSLRGLDVLCLQRERDGQALKTLTAPDADVRVCGVVKFESSTRSDENESEEKLSSLGAWLKNTQKVPLLIAGSTHPQEEDFVLDAWEEVRKTVPCALVIAPRRVERTPEIEALIQARGWKTWRRSQWQDEIADQTAKPESFDFDNPTVYILDSLGELATVYQLGVASFVGGTLYEIGHNVVEPLVCGIPCAFGLGNGRDNAAKHMRDICRDAGVGFEVTSPPQLAAHWREVVTDAALREHLREQTCVLLQRHRGAAARNVEAIIQHLPNAK